MTEHPPRLVLATTAGGPTAPNFRVRVEMFRESLHAHGVELHSRPLLRADEAVRLRRGSISERVRLLANAHRRQLRLASSELAGTVLVSRQASLNPFLAAERALSEGRRVVYDVDDAIWFSGHRAAGGHRLAGLKRSATKARWLAERADTVLAGNEILAEWLGAHSAHVQVVPSVVTPMPEPRSHHNGAEAVVGWIGSHSTAQYLATLVEPLVVVARALAPRGVRLLIVGGNAFAVPGVVVEALPWSVANERAALARMDVGLMPLPDNEWTRGKCAYKAVQYMGAGIPVAADPVGVARSVVEGNGAGVTPSGSAGWSEALRHLLEDADARRELGRAGHTAAVREFSVARWSPTILEALTGGS